MKDPASQPARFYVGAEKALSITADFSDFDADINKLRRRLRQNDAQTFDTFPEYSSWFRRRFGIETEQALDLFHQTVSMKSVGNLTDFVRGHMLEPFDVEARITALIAHFDDLDRAHAAVIRAKRQVALLEPIVIDCDKHEELRAEVEELRSAREFLEAHFATLKLDLLDKRATTLDSEHERQTSRIQGIAETLAALRRDEADLNRQIAENGGDRIATLTAKIAERSTDATAVKPSPTATPILSPSSTNPPPAMPPLSTPSTTASPPSRQAAQPTRPTWKTASPKTKSPCATCRRNSPPFPPKSTASKPAAATFRPNRSPSAKRFARHSISHPKTCPSPVNSSKSAPKNPNGKVPPSACSTTSGSRC
jgi:hypothetical protein